MFQVYTCRGKDPVVAPANFRLKKQDLGLLDKYKASVEVFGSYQAARSYIKGITPPTGWRCLMLTLEVKKEHIEKGKETNSYECPIALAVIDCLSLAFPLALDNINVYVGDMVSRCSIGPFTFRANHPKIVKSFIDRFDSGERVEPFQEVIVLKELASEEKT